MCLLLERLSGLYQKKARINNLLYASNSGNVTNVVEPYNAVLSTQNLLEHSTLVIMNTNLGLYNHCQLHNRIEAPTHKDINALNSQAMSHMIGSSISLESVTNNLVPYSRIKFVTPAFKEIRIEDEGGCIDSLSKQAFEPLQYLCQSDFNPRIQSHKSLRNPIKSMASSLFYRGYNTVE